MKKLNELPPEAIETIRKLFGLLRVPEASWTEEEKRFFREVQTLIQDHQKEISNGERQDGRLFSLHAVGASAVQRARSGLSD